MDSLRTIQRDVDLNVVDSKLDGVENLVSELLKDFPDEKKVQLLMKKHSLPCPDGRVERMKLVLDLIGGRCFSAIPG